MYIYIQGDAFNFLLKRCVRANNISEEIKRRQYVLNIKEKNQTKHKSRADVLYGLFVYYYPMSSP